MRPITKILLLVVVAFVVYLLWPRTANMKEFDPVKLAGLQVASWQGQKDGKGFDTLKARYKIYTSQYNFDPISAFRIAQNQAAALKSLKLSREENGDPNEESRAIAALTEKYTWIRKQAKLAFDADAMAREEFAWLLAEYNTDGTATPADIATPLSRVLAGLYGGTEADFQDVATDIVNARALIFKGDPATGQPDVYTAKTTAIEAYKLLSEIAKTPPAATPAP
jgi:hypothetical protein